MARYRKIETRIWNDQQFNLLADDAKLLFFFLLTHPHLTALGAMRISILGMAGELSWSEKKLREAFRQILEKDMVRYDPVALFLWLPNFLKYNLPESPNVVKSWEQSLDYLPECVLKQLLMKSVRAFVGSLSEGFMEALPEVFREGFAKSMPNQEQEQEQEQKQEQYITCEKPPEIEKTSTTVIEIPLNTGPEFQISEKRLEQWQVLYPAVDVLQELRNIRGWNLANPTKRKTKSGILKHINSWLSRAQNSPGKNYQSRSPPNTSSLYERNVSTAEQWLRESESREKNIFEGEVIRETGRKN
jgi:hypothetical protein